MSKLMVRLLVYHGSIDPVAFKFGLPLNHKISSVLNIIVKLIAGL